MAFTDKTLVCKECGEEFLFSASEQEFYAEKAFKMSLRAVRIAGLSVNNREMLAVKCSRLFALIAAQKPKYLLSR